MSQLCLEDPLGTAKLCSSLAADVERMGFALSVNSDLRKLSEIRVAVRNDPIAPFFDPNICNLSADRTFWMGLNSATGATVALQAFRYDYVDTSLADWGPSYIIGLYMLRQEMLIPTHTAPPKNSIAERIRGKLVYHGEFWFDPHVRNRQLFDSFSRLGIILSLMKWNPDALWALSSQRMATHGHLNRMGYTYLEKGFLRWQWASDGMDPVEWLAVAERPSLEQMINEASTSHRPAQA
jgi:hypothetical protein